MSHKQSFSMALSIIDKIFQIRRKPQKIEMA